MDNQTAFDKAVQGLASQGFQRSISAAGKCLYTDFNGRHCALGWLAESEAQASRWDLASASAWDVAEETGLDLDFSESLQSAHDNSEGPGDMARRLRVVARDFNLNVSALDSALD